MEILLLYFLTSVVLTTCELQKKLHENELFRFSNALTKWFKIKSFTTCKYLFYLSSFKTADSLAKSESAFLAKIRNDSIADSLIIVEFSHAIPVD